MCNKRSISFVFGLKRLVDLLLAVCVGHSEARPGPEDDWPDATAEEEEGKHAA